MIQILLYSLPQQVDVAARRTITCNKEVYCLISSQTKKLWDHFYGSVTYFPEAQKGYLAQAFAQHNLEAYWRWQMIQMTQRYKNINDNAMAQFARTSFPLADKTSAKTNIFCVPLLLRQKETKKLVQRRCCLAKKQHRDSDEYSEIILNFRSYYYIEFIKIFFHEVCQDWIQDHFVIKITTHILGQGAAGSGSRDLFFIRE